MPDESETDSSANGEIYYNCDQCEDFNTTYEALLIEHVKYYHTGSYTNDLLKDCKTSCDSVSSKCHTKTDIKMELDFEDNYVSKCEENHVDGMKQEWFEPLVKFELDEQFNTGVIVHKDVFECLLCDEIFVSKENYSSHLASKVHAFNEISNSHVPSGSVSTGNSDDDSESNSVSHKLRGTSFSNVSNGIMNTCIKEEDEYDYLLKGDENDLLRNINETNDFQCKQCNFIAMSVKGIRTHIYKKHVQGYISFSCEVCSFETPFRSAMNDHYCTCHKDVQFTCDLCNLSFKSFRAFDRHHRDHAFTEKCEICNEEVIGKYKIYSHYYNNHKGYVFRCEQCSYTSTSCKLFVTHLSKASHLNQKRSPCDLDSSSNSIFNEDVMSSETPDLNKSVKDENSRITRTSSSSLSSLEKRELEMNNAKVDDNYKCNICDCFFETHLDLELHMKELHGYRCSKCNHVACSVEALNSHDESHKVHPNVDTEQQCPFCCRRFPPYVDVAKHIAVHHAGDKPYKCDFCKLRFTSSTSLKFHLDSEHAVLYPFACEQCPKRYQELHSLTRHIQDFHVNISVINDKKEDPLDSLKISKRSKKMTCTQCSFQTKKKNHFKKHMSLHSLDRKYQCSICMKRFSTVGQCRAHERNVHIEKVEEEITRNMLASSAEQDHNEVSQYNNFQDKPSDEDDLYHFACNKCKRAFVTRKSYKTHMGNHDPKKHIVCKVCKFRFKKKSNLVHHERCHRSKSPHVCGECYFRFAKREHYENHVTSHRKYQESAGLLNVEETYLTTDGNKTPSTTINMEVMKEVSNLQEKIPVNEDQYNLSCNICKRTFDTYLSRLQHMSSHNSKRHIVCKVCNFRFKSKSHLTRHQRYHKPQNAFVCEKCNFSFAQKRNYDNHKKSHQMYEESAGSLNFEETEFTTNENESLSTHSIVNVDDIDEVSNTTNNENKISEERDQNYLVCHTCKRIFDTPLCYTRHMNHHNTRRHIVCKTCNFRFKEQSNLLRHESYHKRQNRHVCVECFFRFAKKEIYEAHMKSHRKYQESASLLTLEDCNLATNDSQNIHVDVAAEQNQKDCHICKRVFETNQGLIGHLNYHNPRRLVVCKLCNFRFKIKSHLAHHQHYHQPQNTFVCVKCNLRFSKKSSYLNHMLSHEKYKKRGDIMRSEGCDFSTNENFRRTEFKEPRIIEENISDEQNQLVCNKCKRTFDTPLGHKKHMLLHNTRRKIVCNTCNFRFKLQSHLDSHQHFHKSEHAYPCEKCNLRFSQKKNYIPHVNSHEKYKQSAGLISLKDIDSVISKNETLNIDNIVQVNVSKKSRNLQEKFSDGRNQLACNKCERIFDTLLSYDRHMHLHNTRRRIVCKICNFRLKNQSQLENHHQRVHNFEQTNVCEKCNLRFSHKSYSSHMRSHRKYQEIVDLRETKESDITTDSNEKPGTHDSGNVDNVQYTCKLCNFKSKSRSLHMKHNIEEHGKWYKCTICCTSWESLRTLRNHVSKEHDQLVSSFTCTCGYVSQAPKLLSNHIYKYHRSFRTKKVQSKTSNMTPLILISPLKLNSITSKYPNESVHDLPFKCVVCETVFDRILALKIHMENIHHRSSYKCWDCGFICNKAFNLTAHFATHSNYLKCPKCHQEYKTYGSKLRHMLECKKGLEG